MEPISKRDAKLDKIHRKRQTVFNQVLKLQIKNSSLSQNPSDDKKNSKKDQTLSETYIDPQTQYFLDQTRIEKAQQWWQELDDVYFKSVKRKNILLTRDLTSGQRLINFFNIEGQLQGSFENQQIYEKFPLLTENTLIHVLFKSFRPFSMELVTYSFANYIECPGRRVSKILKEQEKEDIADLNDCKITSKIKKLKFENLQLQPSEQVIEQVIKIGNLELQAILQDDSSIWKLEKTQKTKYQMQFCEDIDAQLKLWQHQIDQQSTHNSILWNNLISNHQSQPQNQLINFYSEVQKIRQNLMHFTILRYIEHGTKDKTYQMVQQLLDNMKLIKPAKTREPTSKKFFQTDCKICFCSFNSDSNQVLYCDMCNTSFHLACYGLKSVPQDKEYFCDRCTAIKKDEKTKNNIRKITCQICCKPNFPIKVIDGHYYHMTCLILLNFIFIKQGQIQLKTGLSHQKIIKQVIQNQIECQSCIFCISGQGAELGMRFSCSVEGCVNSMHPICAYINGCDFNVRRNMTQKKVVVNIRCKYTTHYLVNMIVNVIIFSRLIQEDTCVILKILLENLYNNLESNTDSNLYPETLSPHLENYVQNLDGIPLLNSPNSSLTPKSSGNTFLSGSLKQQKNKMKCPIPRLERYFRDFRGPKINPDPYGTLPSKKLNFQY